MTIMEEPAAKTWTWWRERVQEDHKTKRFLVSSSRDHLSRQFINTAFASDDMPWAKFLPPAQLEAMIKHSQTLGLYLVQDSNIAYGTPLSEIDAYDLKQVGIARFVTDYITTVYLCDVYLLPEFRGTGMGRWLVQCCSEIVESMPGLRRILLHASSDPAKVFYSRELGVWDVEEEKHLVSVMTKRAYSLEKH